MSVEDTIVQLNECFEDALNAKVDLNNVKNSYEIEEWDSLGHMMLISVIETKFNIKFNIQELEEIKDIKKLISLTNEKAN